MKIPPIPLRRNPRIALIMLVFGLIAAGAGLFFGQIFVIFLGIFPILLAAMLMLNPMLLLADDHVELKNIFGLTRARYDHDGMHLIEVIANVIYIRKGDLRAPLTRVVQSRMHPGDWQVMLQRLEATKIMRQQQGKSPSTR